VTTANDVGKPRIGEPILMDEEVDLMQRDSPQHADQFLERMATALEGASRAEGAVQETGSKHRVLPEGSGRLVVTVLDGAKRGNKPWRTTMSDQLAQLLPDLVGVTSAPTGLTGSGPHGRSSPRVRLTLTKWPRWPRREV
jgi:hypothetical protein